MKRNLILFTVACALAVFTYFFQELPDRQRFSEEEKRGMLLDPSKLGELKGFSLPQVSLIKQGEQYLLESGEIADERKIDWFMTILAGIKMKRVLPEGEWKASEREQFFPDDNEKVEFVFANGRVSFLLGKQLYFDQSFYMEVVNGDKVSRVVAFDSGPMETVYDKEQGHRSNHRYRRFQSLFYLDASFFRDYRIFRHWMNKKWSLLEVEVDSKRNRKYDINFPEAKTNPGVPFFLRKNKKVMKSYEQQLVGLEGKGYATNLDKNFEEEPLATLVVNSTQGEARLKLLKSKRDKKGYFLKSSLDDKVYVLEDKHTQVFLRPVQDFWDLKISEKPITSLTLGFPGEDPISVNFDRKNGLFSATAAGKEASHKAFNKLVGFLSRPAQYWVAGFGLEEGYIEQFSVDWGFGPFFLMIRSGEILLYHKEKAQGLVFPIVGSPPFPMVKEKYFL